MTLKSPWLLVLMSSCAPVTQVILEGVKVGSFLIIGGDKSLRCGRQTVGDSQ